MIRIEQRQIIGQGKVQPPLKGPGYLKKTERVQLEEGWREPLPAGDEKGGERNAGNYMEG